MNTDLVPAVKPGMLPPTCIDSPEKPGVYEADDPFNCVFVLPTGKAEGRCSVEWVDSGKGMVGVSFAQMGPTSREVIESYCQSPF